MLENRRPCLFHPLVALGETRFSYTGTDMRVDENGAVLFSEIEMQEADRVFNTAYVDARDSGATPKGCALAGLISVMGYSATLALDWAKN